MKPPKDQIAGRKTFLEAKQTRPTHRDQRLPLYTTPLRSNYIGIEGLKPRMLSQQASVGNQESFKPHLRSLPLRSTSEDVNLRPVEGRGVLPTHDRSNQAARPFTGLDLLGFQKKARYNKGNVYFTQKKAPIIYSFN